MEKKRRHTASEFARLSGVTVRALHHYDRLGLLKPARTASGYRVYDESDLARLQQIVTLKFIGLPLKQIRELLSRKSFDIETTLHLQRRVIEEKRRRLDQAIEAIEKAERAFSSTGRADWKSFRKIIEVINMENNMEWMNKYYDEEARRKIADRDWTPKLQAQTERDWATLIKDVEASLDLDPASDRAQELAERWTKLIEGFSQGDAGIAQGLRQLYSDEFNWPSTFQKPYSDEVEAFISKAVAVRNSSTGSQEMVTL
jgi:DNA-binding transcriptional MerR regulator